MSTEPVVETAPEQTPEIEQPFNMENRILTLAKLIGESQALLAKSRIITAKLQADMEARKLFLAPMEGWPGSNEGARKLSAETTFAADKVCISIREVMTTEITAMAENEAYLATLEAERRGYEWVITNRLIDALHDRWDGLNPGRVAASKVALFNAREEALEALTEDPEPQPEINEDLDTPF
jgi:hypothetical protein